MARGAPAFLRVFEKSSARLYCIRSAGRLGDIHASPERDIIAYRFCFWFRIGIGPGSIRVERTVDGHGEIVRRPLPRADTGLGRLLKKIPVNRVRREIVIALDD